MADKVQTLENFMPQKPYFIGVDSDGCAFDSMEIKHKECFVPALVSVFELQPVSKYAREVWEWVNLYSIHRGINRFKGAVLCLEETARRKEVATRGWKAPALDAVKDWIRREPKLGNATLEAEIARNPDPILKKMLEYSNEVNEAFKRIVRNLPPFPFVEQCLEKMKERADVIVVSAQPGASLEKEWAEAGLARGIRALLGQEGGTKSRHLAATADAKYPASRRLMIGDAKGDLDAAAENGFLFYPIVPGAEDDSWKRLLDEGLPRFFEERFAGAYAEGLLKDFFAKLPEKAPWM